jgi:hypothetical protein
MENKETFSTGGCGSTTLIIIGVVALIVVFGAMLEGCNRIIQETHWLVLFIGGWGIAFLIYKILDNR